MKDTEVYLKTNVLVEPLINQWYAWAALVAPHTQSLFLEQAHLKMMRSFVSAPQIHVNALKNPEMMGGPFINYPADRVPQIKRLIEATLANQGHMLKLAGAIKKLRQLLDSKARGQTLEPLYAEVPAELKGYVELVYDLNNHPDFRVIEGLLYHSAFANHGAQSVALSLTEKENRSYLLSTPRLKTDDQIHLNLPLHSESLDQLFQMKRKPGKFHQICERLGVKDQDLGLFETLFTQTPPPQPDGYQGDGLRIRYFGHACLLLETRQVSIMLDPVITSEGNTAIPRYSFEDLPETIDYVVLTHTHGDHFMLETLLQLRHKVKTVVVPRSNGGYLSDPSLKWALLSLGFPQVVDMDDCDVLTLPDGHIYAAPFYGEHGDLNIQSKKAFWIQLAGRSLVFAADSNNFEPSLYQHLRNLHGPVDLLFLGMECNGAPLSWLYGPLMPRPLPRQMDQSRRIDGSDFKKGLAMIKDLGCKQVYIYAMGMEPWLIHLTSVAYSEASRPHTESEKLLHAAAQLGLTTGRPFGQWEIIL